MGILTGMPDVSRILSAATAAALVKLRYFAGLSLREAAAALDLAPRSAEAIWAYARA